MIFISTIDELTVLTHLQSLINKTLIAVSWLKTAIYHNGNVVKVKASINDDLTMEMSNSRNVLKSQCDALLYSRVLYSRVLYSRVLFDS